MLPQIEFPLLQQALLHQPQQLLLFQRGTVDKVCVGKAGLQIRVPRLLHQPEGTALARGHPIQFLRCPYVQYMLLRLLHRQKENCVQPRLLLRQEPLLHGDLPAGLQQPLQLHSPIPPNLCPSLDLAPRRAYRSAVSLVNLHHTFSYVNSVLCIYTIIKCSALWFFLRANDVCHPPDCYNVDKLSPLPQ